MLWLDGTALTSMNSSLLRPESTGYSNLAITIGHLIISPGEPTLNISDLISSGNNLRVLLCVQSQAYFKLLAKIY
jgi:hypothetical protein